MTPRATEEKTSNKRTEEVFDFPETSDLCDFGYVLAGPADSAVLRQPANTQPSK